MLEQPSSGLLGPKVSREHVLAYVLQDILPNLLWYQELEVCSNSIFPRKLPVEHTLPQDKGVPNVPIVLGLGTWSTDWWSVWSVSIAYQLMLEANMHILLKLLQLSGVYPPVLFWDWDRVTRQHRDDRLGGRRGTHPHTQAVALTTTLAVRVHRNQTQAVGPMDVRILRANGLGCTSRWVGHTLSSVLIWHLWQGPHLSGSSGTGQQ